MRNSNDKGQNPLQSKIRKEEKDKVRNQISKEFTYSKYIRVYTGRNSLLSQLYPFSNCSLSNAKFLLMQDNQNKIEVRNSNDRGQKPLQTKIRKEEKDKVRNQI